MGQEVSDLAENRMAESLQQNGEGLTSKVCWLGANLVMFQLGNMGNTSPLGASRVLYSASIFCLLYCTPLSSFSTGS